MSYLRHGVLQTAYYYSDLSEFLEDDNSSLIGNNIGMHGENLTISFLSLNRIEMSIRLLNSIEEHLSDFKGEVLIVDNGSDEEQLSKLEEYCSRFLFNYRFVKLGKNFGVAAGRNRTVEAVQTEWVLCLDNDIYFINNPLHKICEEISQLGCHFLNLPLLEPDQDKFFSLGGHLDVYSRDGDISVGGGSCYQSVSKERLEATKLPPFLSTFLFGGASILRKKTFHRLGGYDEGMFVGLEDVDFSIRLFREGLKVGNSCVFSLVHDHPAPQGKLDEKYEKERYSVSAIEHSARYLEMKYGYRFWNRGLIDWLVKKNEQFGEDVDIFNNAIKIESRKPRIALITDVDYWAFGNIARQIEKNLNAYFEFDLISFEKCDWDATKLLAQASDCDMLHFFWREMIPRIQNNKQYAKFFGDVGSSYFLEETLKSKKLSTCVYDHLFLDSEEEINKRISIFQEFNYYVSSNKLKNIYDSIEQYSKPLMVIEDGVDSSLFYPINIERFKEFDRPLVIGWVGNSKWTDGTIDYKGFNSIVKPLIENMVAEGYNVKGLYCDRVERIIPHEKMVDYYKEIDVLVCMSLIEGTPNPVIEAMACGIPVISTDVGIVPQVLGSKQMEFVIPREQNELRQAILKLLNKRVSLSQLSEENIAQVSNWSWVKQCEKFRIYFEQVLGLN